jgi:transposase
VSVRPPPRRPSGRANLARTLASAATVIACLIGVSFGLQALSLVRADPTSKLAVEAVAKLEDYHDARARIVVNGIRLEAVCVQGWDGRRHVATVKLSDGHTLIEVGEKLVNSGPLAEGEFELAGCPRALTRLLADALRNGDPLRLAPTRFRGVRAYRLSFPGSSIKLSLVIPRRGGLPLALGFDGPLVRGSSQLGYGRDVADGS